MLSQGIKVSFKIFCAQIESDCAIISELVDLIIAKSFGSPVFLSRKMILKICVPGPIGIHIFGYYLCFDREL